jgi:prepilin-type N-terminal cleavage/methylation domain-containing protein
VQERLQQRIHAAREREGGFTLIELLIVIVILGVLAGIVVFSVNFIQDRGIATACKTDVRNVQTAVESYKAATNGYPAGDTATVAQMLAELQNKGYIKNPPSSPDYTIAYDAGNHLVSGTLTAGGAC